MNNAQKIALNTILQFFGTIGGAIITFVITVLLTRHLGKDGYGEYNIILVYISFFAVLTDFGISLISVREMSKNEDKIGILTSALFYPKIFLGIAIFGVSSIIVLFLPYSSVIKTGIIITSIGLIFRSISYLFTAIFQAKLKIYYTAGIDLLGKSLNVFVIFAAIRLFIIPTKRYDAHAFLFIVFGLLAAETISLILNYFVSKKLIKILPSLDKKIVKNILIQAWPLGIITFLSAINFKIDSFLLSIMKDSAVLGIYSVAYRILELLLVLPGLFISSAFPILTKLEIGIKDQLHFAIQKSFDFLTILSLPIAVGVFTLAPRIIQIIAGNQFTESVLPLRILMVAIFTLFLNSLFVYLIIIKNQQMKILLYLVFNTAINAILCIIFIPKFSYVGAAVVTVIMEIAGFSINFAIAYHYYRFFPNLIIVVKSLFASFVMIAVINYFSSANIMVAVFTATIAYTTALFILKGVDTAVIRAIFNKTSQTTQF